MDIAKLLDPIGEGAGSDVRYDPLFDALQSEVEKLTCPSFTGIVDWDGVVELASDILAAKSKDLVVASYLAVALVHTREADGVVPALHFYHGMLERFWEDLYPAKNKVRGRVLALEWWLEKTLKALEGKKVALTTGEGVVALELLEKIEGLLRERLPDAPTLEALKRYFREKECAAAEEQRGAAEASGECGKHDAGRLPERTTAAPEGGRGGAGVAVPESVPREVDLEGALQRVAGGAGALRQEDPCDPASYRLLRCAVWGGVSAVPPALEGRTRIPPPDRQQTALLRELRQKSSAAGLLEGAESRLPQFIFWLDLNRLSFEALGQLGESFAAAREGVLRETLHLLARLPGLAELSFSDGTPFADPETRRWLQQGRGVCAPPPLQLAPPAVAAGAGGEGDPLAAALEEAQLLAREGKLPDAVHALHEKLRSCRSGRERLSWRVALVDFLLKTSPPRCALPQLEEVLDELDHHALERYDPPLALAALRLAFLAFRAQPDPPFQEKAQAALFRVGRLDPAEMVRLEGEREGA